MGSQRECTRILGRASVRVETVEWEADGSRARIRVLGVISRSNERTVRAGVDLRGGREQDNREEVASKRRQRAAFGDGRVTAQ
jgi:hypothetical protein